MRLPWPETPGRRCAAALVLSFAAPFQRLTRSQMSKRDATIYKVIFLNQGQVYELYARQIRQSDLWGFLEIEEFVFGERTQMLIDPGEERLRGQFEGVQRSFVPLHAIVRIDVVERLGTARISEAKGGNVTPFPLPPLPDKS
ncbi:hypothetical protein SAMN04244547_04099 [Azotobacter vinelandii]|nr:hypothetical protein SAMN04244547_04099 [Azotobacter vinelandii]